MYSPNEMFTIVFWIGSAKFDSSWKLIRGEIGEASKNFVNFQQGRHYMNQRPGSNLCVIQVSIHVLYHIEIYC